MLCAGLWCPSLRAAERNLAPDHFEKHVRPLLASKCWECHGPIRQEGDLRLAATSGQAVFRSRLPVRAFVAAWSRASDRVAA
jgi:hypothetical protein